MAEHETTGPASDPDDRMPLEQEVRPETGGIAGAMSYVPAGRPDPASCYICGGPFKGGASHSARTLPVLGIVQACRLECSTELAAIRVAVAR